MRPGRLVAVGGVAAALLGLTACAPVVDDGTPQVTVALGGPPEQPAQTVQVLLDGPVQRELAMQTGGDTDVDLPPGEYAVTIDGQSNVCPNRFDVDTGQIYLSLLWPMADDNGCPDAGPPPDGPSGGAPPPPPGGGPPPPPDSPQG